MKMKKIALAVVVASTAAVGVVGCHDSKDHGSSPDTETTTIEVFDGYALECDVSANGIAAEEVGGGTYTITDTTTLPPGAVVEATGCEDADTGALLPDLTGVAQEGGVAVSPFTTLIVAIAVASGGDPANLTDEAIAAATATVVEKFDLGSYNPTDPATANYVETVADSEESQGAMQLGLALTTLLKVIERATGDDASTAISALATVIADTDGTIDLAEAGTVESLLAAAATEAGDETLTAALEDASDAAASIVQAIASAESVGQAAAAAEAAAEVLNDETTDITTVIEDINAIDVEELEPIDVGNGGETPPLTGGTGGTGGAGG